MSTIFRARSEGLFVGIVITVFHRQFEKEFKKLSAKDKTIVLDRLDLFAQNPFDRLLRNHPLKGKYLGYRSIDIKPDLRVLYYGHEKIKVIFARIGTHS